MALCLWGLDDRTFAPLAPILRWRFRPVLRLPVLRKILNGVLAALMAIGGIELIGMFAPSMNRTISPVLTYISPFQIVNTYGLFAVMTTTRPEIVIEGSNDGLSWREYNFRYKPGNLHRALPFVAPYQPRLDWQMWFAALGNYQENTWVGSLVYHLLQGDPTVTGLLEPPPFPKPPKYMRALLYRYQFTTPEDRARTGAVWQRELQGTWLAPVSLPAH